MAVLGYGHPERLGEMLRTGPGEIVEVVANEQSVTAGGVGAGTGIQSCQVIRVARIDPQRGDILVRVVRTTGQLVQIGKILATRQTTQISI